MGLESHVVNVSYYSPRRSNILTNNNLKSNESAVIKQIVHYACSPAAIIRKYRVIHMSLRDFNQDRYGRKEHINR